VGARQKGRPETTKTGLAKVEIKPKKKPPFDKVSEKGKGRTAETAYTREKGELLPKSHAEVLSATERVVNRRDQQSIEVEKGKGNAQESSEKNKLVKFLARREFLR